jgi:hypothetical protein
MCRTFHEKRTFFVGNPRGMGEAYSRVCRRFRTAFNANRAASIRSVYEALCTEAAQRFLKAVSTFEAFEASVKL